MSRHQIRMRNADGKAITVTLGYDRPLDYVFCTVFREGEESSPIYSNLGDPRAGTHQQDINYFRRVLAGLGVKVPEQMFVEVEADQLMRIGNRNVDHTPLQ